MDRNIKKKKWPPRKIALYGLPSLFILIMIWSIGFGDHSSKLNVQTDRITLSTVRRDEFQEFIPVTGTVIPIRTIYLDAVEGADESIRCISKPDRWSPGTIKY
jgi:HlyD family secretion protein